MRRLLKAEPHSVASVAYRPLRSGLGGNRCDGKWQGTTLLFHKSRFERSLALQTLAFLLPALVHVAAQPRSGSGEPVVLVLAPTRELAMQTADVAATIGAECDVRSVCVYGGAPKGPQHAALRGGATIVVATPGRLEDLHEAGAVSYARVTFFVLDEADRMLDLGFEPAVRRIVAGVQPARQTVMFSATWPPSIRSLAAEFMVSPVMVRIGAEGTRASHSITQIVEVLDSDARVARLEQLLMQYQGGKDSSRRCLIFGLYKIEVTRIAATLRQRGWRCCEIQGDMLQKARTDAVASFKSAATPILVATDGVLLHPAIFFMGTPHMRAPTPLQWLRVGWTFPAWSVSSTSVSH